MADEVKPKASQDDARTGKEEGTPEEAKPEAAAEEKKVEAPKEEAAPAPVAEESKDDAAEEVEVPKEFKKIVEEIEGMSVLQLNELVKVFEKKFGVSAAAVAAGPATDADAEGAEEKDEFTVELTSFGESKIAVIKVVKEATALGLKDAKELVESAPAVVKEALKKEDAEVLKGKIEEAGGSVELK